MSLESVVDGVVSIANVNYDPVVSSHETSDYYSVVISVGFTGKELETLESVYKVQEIAPTSINHKEGGIEVIIEKID